MVEVVFYARGDSGSAQNASLNSMPTSQVPVTELRFLSDPDAPDGGDIKLDPGEFDPDTLLYVNGVETTFRVELTGTIPMTAKFANIAGVDVRGEEVVIITDLSTGQRYYFFTDGSGTLAVMQAMPNGAISILDVTTGTTVLICFASGTLIATPDGEVPVENLRAGDIVCTEDGPTPLCWTGARTVTSEEMAHRPEFRPVTIRAGAFGPSLPHSDLVVSQQHRVMLADPQLELLFCAPALLTAARHLVNGRTIVLERPETPVTYHHLMFDQHRLVRSNGLETESFYAGATALSGLESGALRELLALFPVLRSPGDGYGAMALPGLKARETRLAAALLLAA